MDRYQQIVLASRPTGAPVAENFRLESGPMPVPTHGEGRSHSPWRSEGARRRCRPASEAQSRRTPGVRFRALNDEPSERQPTSGGPPRRHFD